MTRFSSLLALAVPAALSLATPASAAEQLDGKKIFLGQKCETCHAVSSAEIKATGKIKAPDLTGTAVKRDATALSNYLRQKDQINNKKHVKAFTGTDEELGALIAWLQKQGPTTK
jgi:mono/diheme cytochrome c family protein